MANALELNETNFDQEVMESERPVLVDFFADWCGPCKMQLPVVDELANEFNGRASITKLNVDSNQEKAAEYGIAGIPALLVFKNGEVVERLTGLHSQGQLSDILNKHV